MPNSPDDHARAVERYQALFAAYGQALAAQDPKAPELAEECRAALQEIERCMPENERKKVRATVAAVDRLVAYAKALQEGDRAETDRLYAEMSPEDRASIQHAHDDRD